MNDERDDEDDHREDWTDIDQPAGDKSRKPDPVFVILQDEAAIVVDPGMIESLHENGYFGNVDQESGLLSLYPEEAMIFSERKRLLASASMDIDAARTLLPGIKETWAEQGFDGFSKDERFMNTEALFTHFERHVPDFWELYVVYRELKTRGYVVRRGVKGVSHFRVFKKGAKKDALVSKFIYFGVFEGKHVSLQKLQEVSDYAASNRQELILAVVDRHMDTSYYNVKKQDL